MVSHGLKMFMHLPTDKAYSWTSDNTRPNLKELAGSNANKKHRFVSLLYSPFFKVFHRFSVSVFVIKDTLYLAHNLNRSG